jgi:hypothetical protein
MPRIEEHGEKLDDEQSQVFLVQTNGLLRVIGGVMIDILRELRMRRYGGANPESAESQGRIDDTPE